MWNIYSQVWTEEQEKKVETLEILNWKVKAYGAMGREISGRFSSVL